jgi:hypothetical protein
MVISFPEAARDPRSVRAIAARAESATVIILPVIRIERYSDEPTGGSTPDANPGQRRRRRRRNSRS